MMKGLGTVICVNTENPGIPTLIGMIDHMIIHESGSLSDKLLVHILVFMIVLQKGSHMRNEND